MHDSIIEDFLPPPPPEQGLLYGEPVLSLVPGTAATTTLRGQRLSGTSRLVVRIGLLASAGGGAVLTLTGLDRLLDTVSLLLPGFPDSSGSSATVDPNLVRRQLHDALGLSLSGAVWVAASLLCHSLLD